MNPPLPTLSLEIQHLSTTTIRPSNHQFDSISHRKIELTPWDLTVLPFQSIQDGLLFLKPKQEEEEGKSQFDAIIRHLKDSFSIALHHFFPLAGRLSTRLHEDDDTTSVYIDCNNAGAEFIHAIAPNNTISDLLNPIYVPRRIIHSLFPRNGEINYVGRSNPLLSVQVTELIDGMFIACTINHAVCDGTSFWDFFNTWSEISRLTYQHQQCHNSIQISRPPPVFERGFLNELSDFPIRLPFRNIDERFRQQTHIDIPMLTERVFHFSPQYISKLKAKAKANSETNNCQISSLQALSAHIWLAVTRAKRTFGSNEDMTHFFLPMGNRTRLKPALPEDYFGNSFHVGLAMANVDELLERGLGFGASLLNQVVKSHTDELIRSSWKSWVEKSVLWFLGPALNGLTLGNSPRFNVYGNDFGWGQPIAVRSGGANKFYEGKMTIYPGEVEGSIDIEVCLSLEILKAMGDDAEFMETVTISLWQIPTVYVLCVLYIFTIE